MRGLKSIARNNERAAHPLLAPMSRNKYEGSQNCVPEYASSSLEMT